jgi:hypothetical protein
MKLKLSLVIAVLSVALAGLAAFATPSASAARPTGSSALTVPVTGTNDINSFAGTFTLTGFKAVGDTLTAVGTLNGTITNLLTGVTTPVQNFRIELPVTNIAGSCQILHLELGPLDLDLLGLQVHLDKVVLDITAQSGPGNLLGNLLCGIAGLLDGGTDLTGLVNTLNQIIRLL